jgi:hypothetical protein
MNARTEKHAHPNPGPEIMSGEPGQDSDSDTVILSTSPERMSFLYKYLMAFVPLLLVLACIVVRSILESLFRVSTSSLASAVPSSMSPDTAGIVNDYSSSITGATDITILMVAPVGIFIFFIAIGWAMQLDEVWTGTLVTLGLSGVTAIVLTFTGSTLGSGEFVIRVLEWIAFLVQPFSLIAAVIVLYAIEKFRQSVHYTITRKGVWIGGGLLGVQEHMIPHNQIGRIVFEQDFFGARYNYGTLIPHTLTRWGAETSIRGVGASGQKDNFGFGVGYAKGREEGSRNPLDCLFGVPDPKKIQKILTEYISRHDDREEEQATYLRKLYELSAADAKGAVQSGRRPRESAVFSGTGIQENAGSEPMEGIAPVKRDPDSRESSITRITGVDDPNATTGFTGDTMREIPPVPNMKSQQFREIPSADSPLDQIKKLADLKRAGIITEEEFSAKKTELLKRL